MPQLPVISKFDKEYRFLSNFYICPVVYGGYRYPSAEHAYQAAKTLSARDRLRVAHQITPGQAKRLGKTLKLRPAWEKKKNTIMLTIVRNKFEINPGLAGRLLETGDAKLIEGNNWGDLYWGMVRVDDDMGKWAGENYLGKILMQVRDELR
jgi:ribA/ribD-fused uncharacterized protein